MGIGPISFDKLLGYFGTAHEAYHASIEDIASIIGPKTSRAFSLFRSTFDQEEEWNRLENKGIICINRRHPIYPKRLLQLADPPLCLYIKGKLSDHDFEKDLFFSIVGTRNPTTYGIQVARKFAREMAESGFTIVSGMAMGIDAEAHDACIMAKGKTIAFLGCGVNIVYPAVNKKLYGDILASGGLIISEFPPDMLTQKGLFVSRNRLISGLSLGVLVAEGLKDSGSLVTARCALEQGKEVFAPPAPINSIQSEAPNLLLKEGAKLVTCKEDILEEFIQVTQAQKQEDKAQKLDGIELLIYRALSQEALSIDDLSRMLHVPIYQVMSTISSLELLGLIEKDVHGLIRIHI